MDEHQFDLNSVFKKSFPGRSLTKQSCLYENVD